jgi:hypothetical protein
MELNPQIIFEKLFGDVQTKTPEERAARREQDRSILDSVSQSLARFKQNLPNNDRHKVDEFTDDIREIERRLDNAKKASGVATGENVVVPAGIPESFDEHINLHFDLTALGFRNDTTRVATMLYAPRPDWPQLPGQRHQNPDRIKDYSKINRQTGLKAVQHQLFPERATVVLRDAPFFVVIGAKKRIAFCPAAATRRSGAHRYTATVPPSTGRSTPGHMVP